MAQSGEELSRVCSAMIGALPENDGTRRQMIELLGEIGTCIQQGNPEAETKRLQRRFRELLSEYYGIRQ